jgi:ABC-2 type transport system ATP-binding protein
LSGGQKRLAQFAISICGDPKLLFLDEPTTHLDTDARETLWSAVRHLVDQGTSVLLTTHYLEEAEALADRVVVISQGKSVATGTVEEVRGVVVQKHIDCTSAVGLDEVRSWPEVEAASLEGRRLRVTTREAEAITRRLLAADSTLSDLEVRRASLAEALKLLTRDND